MMAAMAQAGALAPASRLPCPDTGAQIVKTALHLRPPISNHRRNQQKQRKLDSHTTVCADSSRCVTRARRLPRVIVSLPDAV